MTDALLCNDNVSPNGDDNNASSGKIDFSFLYDNMDAIYNTMKLENDKLYRIFTGKERRPFTYQFFENQQIIYTQNNEDNSIMYSVFQYGFVKQTLLNN